MEYIAYILFLMCLSLFGVALLTMIYYLLKSITRP